MHRARGCHKRLRGVMLIPTVGWPTGTSCNEPGFEMRKWGPLCSNKRCIMADKIFLRER